MEAPKCPVCHQIMTVPIFQCQSGHSVCFTCTKKLQPAICPLCRQVMTQVRNWQLEDIVSSAIVTCPNKNDGCIMRMSSDNMEKHLMECIFRTLDCPLGQACGTCSWTGRRKKLAMHFKEHHAQNYVNKPYPIQISIDNVSTSAGRRHLYLIDRHKQIFILSFKIDTIKNQTYWLVQFMGSQIAAEQYIYEIRLISPHKENRKITFVDYCFSDEMSANDIFRQAKCASMPLDMLSQFLKDSNVTFSCSVKLLQSNSAPRNEPNVPHSSSGSRSNSCTRDSHFFLRNRSKSNLLTNNKHQF